MEIQELLNVLNTIYDKKKESIDFDEEPLLRLFVEKNPNSFLVKCDNESFSSSFILIIKLAKTTKIIFFDQHKYEQVEMNFSPQRLEEFISTLNKIK